MDFHSYPFDQAPFPVLPPALFALSIYAKLFFFQRPSAVNAKAIGFAICFLLAFILSQSLRPSLSFR